MGMARRLPSLNALKAFEAAARHASFTLAAEELFVTHAAISNASLVGQHCKVLTQTVDEKSGRAEVSQRGANINIRVWAHTPNPLARGGAARIVAYEEKTARYRIEADG